MIWDLNVALPTCQDTKSHDILPAIRSAKHSASWISGHVEAFEEVQGAQPFASLYSSVAIHNLCAGSWKLNMWCFFKQFNDIDIVNNCYKLISTNTWQGIDPSYIFLGVVRQWKNPPKATRKITFLHFFVAAVAAVVGTAVVLWLLLWSSLLLLFRFLFLFLLACAVGTSGNLSQRH